MQPDPPTPGVPDVFEAAVAQAKAIGQSFIGTEHLLLGLLEQRDRAVEELLARLGTDTAALTAAVRKVLTAAGPVDWPGPPLPTPALRRTLARAAAQAGQQPPAPLLVLMALAAETTSPAAVMLEDAGLTLERLRGEASH